MSNIVLHVFTPCLIFASIVNSTWVANEWWKIPALAVSSTFALLALSWLIARLLGLSKELTTAFILSTSFVNTGNYGLPLSLFAFGQRGLESAAIFFVVTALLMFTVGVLVASNGKGGLRQALRGVFRLPLIYATLAGVGVRIAGVNLPGPLFQGIDLMSQAAIPAMLILLGMDLAGSRFQRLGSISWRLVSLSSVIKLLFPVLLVSLLGGLIGLSGIPLKVSLVQASMPTAVFVSLIALKFGGDSHFVTTVVVVSTLVSIVTLTLLLSFLL